MSVTTKIVANWKIVCCGGRCAKVSVETEIMSWSNTGRDLASPVRQRCKCQCYRASP